MSTDDSFDLNLDTTPLPGVKANDPSIVADSDKSDDEVAEELARDPAVDSGDGVAPESRDRDLPEGGIESAPFTPVRPHQTTNRDLGGG